MRKILLVAFIFFFLFSTSGFAQQPAALVHDFCPGYCDSEPTRAAFFKGKLYVNAFGGVSAGQYGRELFMHDGTTTTLCADLAPGLESGLFSGSSLLVVGDSMYFIGNTGTWSAPKRTLFKYDGVQPPAAIAVIDSSIVATGTAVAYADSYFVYVMGYSAGAGYRLTRYNPTTGTFSSSPYVNAAGGPAFSMTIGSDGTIYYTMADTLSDETQLRAYNPGLGIDTLLHSDSAGIGSLGIIYDYLYFLKSSYRTGATPYDVGLFRVLAATQPAPAERVDTFGAGPHAVTSSIAYLNNKAYFGGSPSPPSTWNNGPSTTLYVFDPSNLSNTALHVADSSPWLFQATIFSPYADSNRILFSSNTPTDGHQLFSYTPATGVTAQLTIGGNSPPVGLSPRNLTTGYGNVYMWGFGPANIGMELYRLGPGFGNATDISATSTSAGEITLSPNPAGNSLSISLPSAKSSYQVCIISVTGQTMIYTLAPLPGPVATLSIERLPPGMYLIRITDSSTGELIGLEKFIKQ